MTDDSNVGARAAAETWLETLDQAFSSGSAQAVAASFAEEGHWRDIVALGDTFQTVSGRPGIQDLAEKALLRSRPHGFRIAVGRTPPRRTSRLGQEVVEVFFSIEAVALGRGIGVAHLIVPPAGGRILALTLFTALDELDREHSESSAGSIRPFEREFGKDNWLRQRTGTQSFVDRDPAVLVIGCGQAGLAASARLIQAGVDTLAIDRQARLGDNWRLRYDALVLHNQTNMNHLPYVPFPATWPNYIPKDKLANWFESYADIMELNTWSATEVVKGDYDEDAKLWNVTLRRSGGQERVLRPAHIVFATGVSSIPVMPDLPGLKSFRGTTMHSGAFTDGASWSGRRAIVVGTGNSAHDVAQDLAAYGAQVTMVQRSPTYVISIKEAQNLYNLYNEGLPIEDADLVASSASYPVLVESCRRLTKAARAADHELLSKLEARGFRLSFGSDDTGFQMMYLRRGGGYYFNIGCSDLIADGTIDLLQYSNISHFEEDGLRLRDGSLVSADLVVLATGYKNQQDTVRAMFGDAIADKVGPVWGFDEKGELRNMWRPTPQEGLWFTGGGLGQCRIYSKYLAQQIKCSLAARRPMRQAAEVA